jgi:D-alanyl-D-alanine carboxypeptidase
VIRASGKSTSWNGLGRAAAIVGLLVNSLVACTASAPGSSSQPKPTSSASQALESKLRPGIEQTMAKLVIPGAVVLVRTPEGEYLQAFGTRVVGKKDPVQVGDHFRIGSNTKTMTGTALLQLVQKGRIALDDPVSKYRPDVSNGDHITIAQLLDMRSGLDTYSNIVSFNRTLDDDPTKAWNPEELAALGLALPPKFPPGAGFFYSNTNTVLAGLIIEKLTGKKLQDVLKTQIFDTLKLSNTLLPPTTSNAMPNPHPQGYLYGTNVSTIASAALPDDEQKAALAGTLLPDDVTDMNPSWGWAAGAAISNAEDLATYVKALVAGGLLDTALQRTRLDSVTPTNPSDPGSASYGLALAKFGPMLGHDGSLPGFQSFMGYDPVKQNTLIVLTNLQAGPDGEMTANVVAKGIIAQLYS